MIFHRSLSVMGVWSSGDMALSEVQMSGSEQFVTGPWRYERIEVPITGFRSTQRATQLAARGLPHRVNLNSIDVDSTGRSALVLGQVDGNADGQHARPSSAWSHIGRRINACLSRDNRERER